ncbi:MAG: S8 family serine peptidase, partial [Ktedonobacteraceae bacterium]
MPKYMHNTFWLEDQISVTFKVNTSVDTKPTLASIIDDLRQRVDGLNSLLLERSIANGAFKGVSLSFFDQKNMGAQQPSSQMDMPTDEHMQASNDFPGLYLFTPGAFQSDQDFTEARVVSFLSLNRPPSTPPAMADSPSEMPGMSEGRTTPEEGFNDKEQSPIGLIPQIVNLINADIDPKGKQQTIPGSNSQVSISSAAPTYLCGSTSNPQPFAHIGEGCPLSPPIPVAAGASCSSSPGLWPITLPELPTDLQSITGDGVTVFVLDTLPQLEQIQKAAEVAGDNNLLLQGVAKNVTFSYPAMSNELDQPGPLQVATGKDIHGRVVGFKMPDHGMFVAGIIHDLAPKAKIECIRVLNDLCIGSVETITDALNGIHQRMSMGGDLAGKPVVINMSLVIPDDNEAVRAGIDQALLDLTRDGLLAVIQSLVDLGAIFVASAGNEGDLRYNPMNMPEMRPNALYPAAFAYNGLVHPEKMIPVGAVNKEGNATVYSCYPGMQGVATYGGDLPKDADIEDGHGYDMTSLKKIDAPIGLYTSPFYPALSIDDPQATYPAPNASGWAYWIGTSFATPIISAIAARTLELNPPPTVPPNQPMAAPIIAPAATRQTNWTNLTAMTNSPGGGTHTNAAPDAMGPVVWAVQCQPGAGEDEDEDENAEIIVINETEVVIQYEND